MNPLHLIWIIPVAFSWGISTGFYFSKKRANAAAVEIFLALRDREAKRK